MARLSAQHRATLAEHTVGYDISPQMVRIAKVNLYLTHRQEPKVAVYDTPTCEEKWNDHYDVILANPPFMSPKGGIEPHRRFFTNSRRSEALYVDYMVANDGYDLGAQRRPIGENDLPAVTEEINEYRRRRAGESVERLGLRLTRTHFVIARSVVRLRRMAISFPERRLFP